MKTIPPMLMALALFLVAACNKRDADAENASAPQNVTEPAPLPQPPSDEPVANVTPDPVPPPAAPQFAPPGVFFLTAAVSIETSDGIVGFKPGTRLLKHDDGSFDANGRTLQLRPDQITNDLQAVRQITEAEQAARATAHANAAPPRAAGAAPGIQRPSTPAPRVSATTTPVPAPPVGTRMDSSVTRTQGGYIWKRNSKGEWEIVARSVLQVACRALVEENLRTRSRKMTRLSADKGSDRR